MSEQKNLTSQGLYIVIICGCLLCFFSFGMRASMGLFMTPISSSLHWEREIFAFAVALQNLMWGVFAVICGGLVQRFGNTLLIVFGVCTYALGLILASNATTPIAMYTYVGILMGIGIAATSFGIVLPAMARLVPDHRRASILGIGTAAGSAGQFIIILFAQYFVDQYGWQNALFDMGVIMLATLILAIPLSRGDAGKGVNETPHKEPILPVFAKALRHPSYWLVLVGFYVCGFHLAFITAHMPAFLIDNGFSNDVGAWVISIIGFFNIIGAYVAGVLAQKYPNKFLLSGIYALRAVTILAILFLPLTIPTLFIFAFFTGLLWLATIPPTSNLVAKMFGTKHMALLYGLVFFNHQLGSFSGVWLGGWIFDKTGNYHIVWWLAFALAVCTACLHLPINENRHKLFREAQTV